MVDTFHPRRADRHMPALADQLEVLRRGRFLTLAMCAGDEPYLVTLNYVFSEPECCFYVHCATEGKKLDVLRRNPRVWGQVVEDHGYVQGKCTHHYRSVMFQARAQFVEDLAEQKRALGLLIEQFEPDPEPVKKRYLEGPKPPSLVVLRLRVEGMSGKRNPGDARS